MLGVRIKKDIYLISIQQLPILQLTNIKNLPQVQLK